MPDLPLVGGHAPGTSEKVESETTVNLLIESADGGPYVRNRPGYTIYTADPPDVDNDIDSFTVTGTVGKVSASTSEIRYGYDVGDRVTISGETGDTNWNNTWTITSLNIFSPTDYYSFDVDVTENGGTAPTTVAAADGTVTSESGFYRKEVRAIGDASVRGTGGPATQNWWAVIGNRVFNFDATGASPQAIAENSANDRLFSTKGPVAIQSAGDGGQDLLVTDGISATAQSWPTSVLVYDGSGLIWSLVDSGASAWTQSNTATYMDGYLIRDDRSNTGRFIYSDLYDITTENLFNFATAEGSPDDLIAVLADRRQLFLFGEYTTEIWYNAGDKNLPFRRFQGGFVETGIAAPLSAVRYDNSVMWLAQDRRGSMTVVRSGDNFQPVMVSTPQINKLLNDAKEYIYNAFANVIRYEGHEYYILTIPGFMSETNNSGLGGTVDPLTLVYDSNSKVWYRWQSHDDILTDPITSGTDDLGRWMVTAHSFSTDTAKRRLHSGSNATLGAAGHLVGGRDFTGRIYYLTEDSLVDENPRGNEVIECERTLSPVQGPDFDRVNAGPIELVTDQDAGEGGTVTLSYAKDGKTFGTGLARSITATSSRLMWKRVGRARRWIFKLAQDTTATVPVRWLRLISKRLGE